MRMSIKSLRVVCFYGMHLVYFPLLIVFLRLFTHARIAAGIEPPAWLNGLILFALAGGLYVFMGYRVSRWLNQAEADRLASSR